MMFIRPYTISQTAILLLTLFLWLYLRSALPRTPSERRAHTHWMSWAAICFAVEVVLHIFMGMVEAPHVDLLAYLRDPVGLLVLHAIAQAVYAIPPLEPFARRGEPRRATQAIALLVGAELIYLVTRLWSFAHIGSIQPKHPAMMLPLLLGVGWLLLLIARKFGVADRSQHLPMRRWLDRFIGGSQPGVGPYYQGLFVAVGMNMGIIVIFYALVRTTDVMPTWLLVTLDIIVTSQFLTIIFAYLSSPLAATSLEIRLMGAGLIIFLGLISVLGWLITLTALHLQAPGVPPALVIGNQIQAQFFITPAAYRPLAQMLSILLLPLAGFTVVGSLVFVGLYATYYRSTLKASLVEIFEGFGQVQGGNLAHRLPVVAWQDEFSQIGLSFNQMVTSLERANQELQAYQQHLQALVAERTAELGREMARRQWLELHQAIQDERARISQETHDGLLQSLMGVRIRLNRGKRLSRMEATAIEAELAELAGEVTHAMQELRSLINELNEEILPDGLVAGIEAAVARHQHSYPTLVRTELAYVPGHLTVGQELHLLRIVQEALANASRHGAASHAEVCLCLMAPADGARSLSLQIRDNGSGFDPQRIHSKGMGLRNMQRRAAALGAVIEIESAPRTEGGGGTVVRLRSG